MLIAVGTSERRAQSLSRYRRHAEAKSEENKEYGDGSESHMDMTPHLSSRSEITTWQEGDGEGK